ncbi:subclass B3 metallo-beta-lactamase [Sphingomonas sp.]|uniref:subclass B3 metallo-beta-lactamase n=1 Tax=Sphingomonas sp. TaxID=28214 RepID=UPI001E0F4C96|nr:subclass B3 metallo-beta-lactamase [Sphingomonas sp.]MBX9797536.1 subclass B3 metallo-beta-lactamase [Sphingomonas sp.]
MSASWRIGAALLLIGAAPAPRAATAEARAWLDACRGKDGWGDPAPPVRLFGNVAYVGSCGITALLITGPKGHVLIDGATANAAPAIARNIERLGYRLRDVRLILNSHEHVDHAGGLATLRRLTGARVAARAEARAALESGRPDAGDPQAGLLPPFAGVRVDRLVRDGEVLRVGPVVLTAHATPGHSPGSTSWSWRSCAGADCRTIVYADSLSAVSADGYRFSDHPALVATFRATIARVAALRCDMLFTPHPDASDLAGRLTGAQPLGAPSACRRYANAAAAGLNARLAKETGG